MARKWPCRSRANINYKEQLQNLVTQTRAALGKIDVLICNAALNPYFGPQMDIPDDAFDKIMGANIRSNHWLCQLVLPEMVERKDGSIIIVSSIGGLRGSPVLGAYCISKAADIQLARNIAVEYGPHNIRANCIAPGLIKTDFAKRAVGQSGDPEALDRRRAAAPDRRARRDRGRSRVPRVESRRIHDRTGHRCDGGATIA